MRGILRDPAYAGHVYAGRHRSREPRARRSATHPIGRPHGTAEPAPRDERPAAGTVPRSVLLDFQTGLKTTQFEGDIVVREPFDVSAMRAIASPPPSPGPAASAGWLDGRGRRPRT